MLAHVGVRSQIGRVGRAAAIPLRRYLDWRFDRLETRLDELDGGSGRISAEALARIDLTEHNTGRSPPRFQSIVSQAVSAAQFFDPEFERLRRFLYPGSVILPWGASPGPMLHRKVWEFVYVLRAAEQYGVVSSGCHALGFGVGREPIPAALAAHGVSVLATDLDASEREAGAWAESSQHLSSLEALSAPGIVPDDVLERQVSVRYVDMNAVPDDLGTFDLVWSCCAFEHLGGARAGLDFVSRTLDLLRPGGVSVHTTELELTARTTTAEYGHIVVYRPSDLDGFAEEVRDRGFSIETNWYVAMETPADRWIAHHPYDDPAHLKLVIGDSVSTSVGLLIHRPA
jgi:hypothetical protein